MSDRTDVERLQAILGQLAAPEAEVVTGWSEITIGVSNDAYFVDCASGHRYVVRVLDVQTVESATAEAAIQQVMDRHGLSTPVYLPLTDGRFVGQDRSDSFTIARVIPGSHPTESTPGLARSIGEVLGQLHTILDQDEIGLGYNRGQWLDPRNVRLDLAGCDASAVARLRPGLDDATSVFRADLPMAVIHGELATNNVFADGDDVTTIFDFETAQYAPRVLDLTFSYLSFVYDGDLEPAIVLHALTSGYDARAALPLTDAEKAQFPTALRFVSTACAVWCLARDHDDYAERFLAAGAETPPAIPS